MSTKKLKMTSSKFFGGGKFTKILIFWGGQLYA